jgi:hypothetical protein
MIMAKSATAFVIALGSSVALGQPSQTVPASLLERAQRSPVEIVWLLADASIPSGIEFRESDDIYPGPIDFNLDRNRTAADGELVRTFNDWHRDYHAVLMDGVFVIRPADGTVRFLDERSMIDLPVTVTALPTGGMGAERRLFSPLDPGLLGPTGGSSCRVDNDPILLDGSGGRNVIDLLNQIALQARATWYVTTRKHADDWQVAAFGMIYPRCRLNHAMHASQ